MSQLDTELPVVAPMADADIRSSATGAIRSNIRRARRGTFFVSMSSAMSSPTAGLMQTPSAPKRDAT